MKSMEDPYVKGFLDNVPCPNKDCKKFMYFDIGFRVYYCPICDEKEFEEMVQKAKMVRAVFRDGRN